MHPNHLPACAPFVVPLPPPPVRRTTSVVGVVLAATAAALAIGAYVILFIGAVALEMISQKAAAQRALETPPRPTLAVEHMGDDCTAAALRDARECEDMECFATVGAELRACLAKPEEEARACSGLPDPSSTTASAQWMTLRCSFEAERDQNDCVRLVGIVQDHCANIAAAHR